MKVNLKLKNMLLFMLIFLLLGTSCGGEKKKATGDNNENNNKESSAQAKQRMELKGFYVTSQHKDIPKYDASNLFDNSEKAWATMPGAGPDEGIMIYFHENTELGELSVSFAKEAGLENITKLGLYINGQYVYDFTQENNTYSSFDMLVNSIYLRILETDKIKENTLVDNDGETRISKQFSSTKPVGIAELKFKATNGEEIDIIPPKQIRAKVFATSTLEPIQAYGVQNLFDSKYSIAWAEGNDKTSGVGEKIDINFSKDVKISKVKFWNGFQRSETHFDANGRAKTIEIAGNSYQLDDAQGAQEVELKQVFEGRSLSFVIKDIYKGSKYEDLVISEMQFFNGQGWFYPQTDIANKMKTELLVQSAEGTLAKVIDKWIYEEYQNHVGDYSEIKSIILRSDYTFVIYTEGNEDYKDAFSRQKIYDGNWSIVELGQNKSKIKIFGKRRIINKGRGAYKGLDETDMSLIFHDYLTITENSIQGERFFDEINF